MFWWLSPRRKQKIFLSTVPVTLSYSHSIYSTTCTKSIAFSIMCITPEADHSRACCLISDIISNFPEIFSFKMVSSVKRHNNDILGYYMMLDQDRLNSPKSWMKMKDSQYQTRAKLLCWHKVWRDVTVGMVQILWMQLKSSITLIMYDGEY